ncbi:hypothetical protein ASPBRDRAFT_53187 [Aspergillus brasiliensis CBS 101740]|uniref:Uncharacterized protein n=1 Tax=Aspergillus brasiliensis (strain CBS 101740 / IMI 381727 / IBT 21946) TaxID=767769 RepID=A0A1L9UUA5_ASPBC|nr:hypothetical protein ASPBRDRAFT_53187 [Aspergillus brasiliensis CBS 101740]
MHSDPSLTAKAASNAEDEVLRPLNELHRIIRGMYHEIQGHQVTILSLEEWVRTIDPNTYVQLKPWPQTLINAYDEYKFFVNLINTKKMGYKEFKDTSDKEELAGTSDCRFKRLQLALEWGQVALSATEARLHVLVTYKNAFRDKRSIDGHIDQANHNLNSARDAVREAGINYRRYWANVAQEPPCEKGIPYEDEEEEENKATNP